MKTFLLTIAAVLTFVTGKTQTFSENFNAATIPSLTATCWIVNNATLTSTPGQAINGNSIYTATVVNENSKVDLYTPIQSVVSSTPIIDFDYRLSDDLSSATRFIHVGFVNPLGVVTKVDMLTIPAGTNTAVLHYSHAFSSVIPGAYRIFFRITGSNGNGNVRVIMDNIASTGTISAVNAVCDFAPIVESTLPVKLQYFNAMLNGSKVDLKWATATEINASHFVVEKSTDGQHYNEAGIVFANGNTNTNTTYSLSDNITGTQATVLYYRLRSVDVDGKSELSETRIIRISKTTENTLSIVTYPNPASNELRITVPANWQNKKVVYELFDLSGRTASRIETANSSQTETINLSKLAPGFYLAKVSCEGQSVQQKIVKQ